NIYAFGCIIHEMLSGESPFKASTPGAVLMKHLTEAPVPLRKLRDDVPHTIERIVMQALEKKSEHWQKEMQDVMFQLKSVEENMKREIPQTLSIGAPGFEKKRKLVLVGSLLFVIVAASVLVIGRGAYWDMPRSSSPGSMQ